MAHLVTYDPADPDVAGRVTSHDPSGDTPSPVPANMLVDPVLPPGRMSYWKHSAGSLVVMSAAEKEALDLGPARTAKKDAIDAKTVADTRLMLGAARDTYITAGETLKASVDAAGTVAAVNAIVDTR